MVILSPKILRLLSVHGIFHHLTIPVEGSLDAKSMRRTGGLSDRQNRPGNAGGSASRRARVCCLHTADIAKSGGLDLLVGRDDGNLVVEWFDTFFLFF